jgi:hypothetical protein
VKDRRHLLAGWMAEGHRVSDESEKSSFRFPRGLPSLFHFAAAHPPTIADLD